MRRLGLFLSDALLLYIALVITLYLRYGQDKFNHYYNLHIIPFSIIFVLWLLIFYIAGFYDEKSFRSNLDFYSNFFQAVLMAGGISVVFFYLIPLFIIAPKTNLLIFIAIFTALETLSRYSWHRLFETKFKKMVLIVGMNPHTLELAEFIKNNPQFGYKLKYVADLEGSNQAHFEDVEIIKNIDDMEELINKEAINTVIITPEAYRFSEITNAFYKSIVNKISFYSSVSFYERLTGKVLLGSINQIWFLENLGEARNRTYELIKHIFDIMFAIVLGTLSLVLYPLIILAIKISSRGSVFYRQTRIGQSGRTFNIVKFRTMVHDAEKSTGAVWALDDDPRATGVGKFLRKTRLDELPQLWNILKGNMSFVGPRAERPEFQELLQKNVPFYEERYLVKPGLSGWAQINFRYGSSVKDAEEKLKYDLYYIKNRSLIFDLGIILKTIRIALQQAGR